jgi:hypothetical protein
MGSVLAGCGSGGVPEPATGFSDELDDLEVACELALLELEQLIVKRSQQPDFPAALLIEARELHQLGQELYLEREYALAMEIIEEGIALVEE